MTNKLMLSVERDRIEDSARIVKNAGYHGLAEELRALLDKQPHTCQEGYGEAMGKVVAVLEDQSCGACDGCANGCKLDRESPQVEPAAPHQGDPVAVGRVSYIGNGFMRVRLNGAAPLLESPLYAEQPAPVAVVLPFAEKVIAKLQRFEACVSDGQDVDIDRHWFDVLTHLGLLRRVQRSPAYWEMTQQGQDVLEAARLNTPQ